MRVPLWAWLWAGALTLYVIARQTAPESVMSIQNSISNTVSNLIAGFEGFSARPYLDEAGRWTIGKGHLIVPGDGYWSPSNPTGQGTVTVAEADAQQSEDTAQARAAINNSVRVQLNTSQTSALLSLAYNIGSSAFSHSTLVHLLNQGDVQGAADQFLVWNKVRDPQTGDLVVSNGLVTRREKERALFLA